MKELLAQRIDLRIPTLGPAELDSPIGLSKVSGDGISDFTPDEARIGVFVDGRDSEYAFERAGAREKLYFKGDSIAAGIVTCGGLCPGMNNVIRGLVMQLWYGFGVRRIVGFRFGFRGLTPDSPQKPEFLTPDEVSSIHIQGGTMLGSSRGPQRPDVMVDTLQKLGVSMVFCIGGDGTQKAALKVYEEIKHREADIAVIGVPKTIDNDMPFIERTFGFDTAVSRATEAIKAAHVEAVGAPDGLGLVKLMGRHSGFIAASATLASGEVNLLLVPELPFDLDGDKGVIQYVRDRIRRRGHCVVVAAEGAGQRHLENEQLQDASGNAKLGDIGIFLKETFKRELASSQVNIKYIDPSYIIRAAPANAGDAIFCGQLAEEAVHAAMAGKTGMVMGLWHSQFTHVPLSAVCAGNKHIDLDSSFWRNALDATGQPAKFVS